MLEKHPELLSEEADSILDTLFKEASNKETADLIQSHRNFLLLCRVGDQALEEISSSSNIIILEDLPNILREILSLSRPQDLPRKITMLQSALSLVQRQSIPILWAVLQKELGSSLAQNTQGNQGDNIEKAIEHFNQALTVLTQADFSACWGMTQNDLAATYSDRILGNKADNIEKAIEYYNQVLEVYTLKDFPTDWTMTQNNLANAYSERIRGDKAENIEKAIYHYNQALEVRTRKDFPTHWAMTQNNLALAYSDRIRGSIAENIEKAISHYHNSLEIYKLGSMPNDFRRTCRLLGDLYLEMGQWEEAMGRYRDAIKAGDLLYKSGLSSDSKTAEVKESANIYRNATLAACNLGLAKEALLTLEKGKTRLLSEALRLKMKKPDAISTEEWMRYKQAAEMYRTVTKPSDSNEDYAQREKKVQKTLGELDVAVKNVQMSAPEFQKELDISDILSIIDEKTALLTFCITNEGSIGFVVSGSSGIKTVDIPDFETEDLDSLLSLQDGQGSINGGWVGDYLGYLYTVGTERQRDAFQAWQRTLNDVLSSIGTRLLYPLLTELPPQITRLIILPSGGLFLLPLHAVLLSDGQLLCQRYCVSYAPSIQLLKELKNKSQTIKGKSLYAVINPQEEGP